MPSRVHHEVSVARSAASRTPVKPVVPGGCLQQVQVSRELGEGQGGAAREADGLGRGFVADAGGEFGDGSLGHVPPVVNDVDVVGEPLRVFHQVGGQHDAETRVAQFADQVEDHLARLRIQAGAGLVEEHDLRVARQGRGQGHALLLPAGKPADGGGGKFVDAQAFDQRIDVCRAAGTAKRRGATTVWGARRAAARRPEASRQRASAGRARRCGDPRRAGGQCRHRVAADPVHSRGWWIFPPRLSRAAWSPLRPRP